MQTWRDCPKPAYNSFNFKDSDLRYYHSRVRRAGVQITGILVAVLACVVLPQSRAAAQIPIEISDGYVSIRASEMLDYVRLIASDKFKGRAAGSDQNYQVVLMLSNAMKEAGFAPGAAVDRYLQPVKVERCVIEAPFHFEVTLDGKTLYEAVHGEDYVFRGFTGSGDVNAQTVFCGYGVTADGYDDYAGVDVKGKIVVALNGLPLHLEKPENENMKLAGFKMMLASRNGAAGLILLGDIEGDPAPPLASVYKGEYPYQRDLPAVKVNSRISNMLATRMEQYFPLYKAVIDESGKPMSFPLKTGARIGVQATFAPEVTAYNVIGRLDGRHPQLKNRYIVVMAHTDHLGHQGGLIFNGADDNASGTAVINALVKAFSLTKTRPQRSILLCGTTGEELGLIGSRHMAANMPVPLKQIDAVINLDMVGMGSFVAVFGGDAYPRIMRSFSRWAPVAGIDAVADGANPASDQRPFRALGVPAVMLLTVGQHPYYHTAHDDAATLDAQVMEDVAKLSFLAVWQLANERF